MSDDLTQLAERIFERLPVKCPTCGSEEPTTYYGSCFDNQHDTVLDPRLPMDPWHAYMQDLRLLLRRLDGMTVGYEVGRTLLAEARDEIARLEAERRDHLWLLKGSRLTLDAIAVGREGPADAEAQAQRIVDHTGHGVTDEPPHTLVENDRLRDEIARLREGIEEHQRRSRLDGELEPSGQRVPE